MPANPGIHRAAPRNGPPTPGPVHPTKGRLVNRSLPGRRTTTGDHPCPRRTAAPARVPGGPIVGDGLGRKNRDDDATAVAHGAAPAGGLTERAGNGERTERGRVVRRCADLAIPATVGADPAARTVAEGKRRRADRPGILTRNPPPPAKGDGSDFLAFIHGRGDEPLLAETAAAASPLRPDGARSS